MIPKWPLLSKRPLIILFVLKSKPTLSVVPRKFVPVAVAVLPVKDQSSPPGEPANATHLVPFQKYNPGATLFGVVPAVAVFQTIVPATGFPPH